MNTIDLTTMGGIATAVTLLVQLGKSILPDVFKGRERLIALALSLALGLGSKLSGIGFVEMEWFPFIITILTMSAASGAIHEHVVKKPTPPAQRQAKPPSQ